MRSNYVCAFFFYNTTKRLLVSEFKGLWTRMKKRKGFVKTIDCCLYFFRNALEFNAIKQLKISYIKTNDKNNRDLIEYKKLRISSSKT